MVKLREIDELTLNNKPTLEKHLVHGCPVTITKDNRTRFVVHRLFIKLFATTLDVILLS